MEFELAGHDFAALENLAPAAARLRNDCTQFTVLVPREREIAADEFIVFGNSVPAAARSSK